MGNYFVGNYSVRRDTSLRLMITPLGIQLMSYVEGIDELHWGWEDFAGDDLSVAIG